MNEKINLNFVYFEKDMFSKILPDFLKHFDNLKNSKPDSKYGLSFREVWGLAIITAFRKFRENNKNWLFIVDKKINDDGMVASFQKKNNLFDLNYSEKIEQIYLSPFSSFKRVEKEKYTDYLIRFLVEKKIKKGREYMLDTSLIILNDIETKEAFEWKTFASFVLENKENFLHFYFLGFQLMTDKFIKYHVFSFTNQKHRQFLNGQFELYIYINGTYKFNTIQEINLLKNKTAEAVLS